MESTNLNHNKYRFLILEDVPFEVDLIKRSLSKEGIKMEVYITDNQKDFNQSLREFKPDLIISDYNLPSYTGMEALQDAIAFKSEIPFIIVTGTLGEEKAVDLLKMGATDFVLKDNLPRLPIVVKRALSDLRKREQDLQTKEELRKLKEHQRQLFQFAPIGISELSLEGQILSINEFGKYLFRITECIMQKSPSLFDLLDTREKMALKQWLKEEHPTNSRSIIIQNNKKDRYINFTCIPHQNTLGENVFIGTFEDVTEQVNIKRQLKEKNQLFETLMETITDIIYLKDKMGRYVMVNKAFEKTFSVKEKDIVGKRDKDFMDQSLAKQISNIDDEIFEKQENVSSILSYERQNGRVTYYDSHNAPFFNESKNIIGIVGACRDITLSVNAEEELKQSEALLLEAENIAGIGSWEFTVAGELITGSIGMMKIFDLSLSKRTWHYSVFINKCHPDDQDEFLSALQNAILEGENIDIEHRVVQAESGIVWVRIKGKVVINESNVVDKIIGTVQDITEHKNIHQRLLMKRELLDEAQAIANIGSFDWSISQNVLHCTDQFRTILDLKPSGIWASFDNYIERIHPSDRELTRNKIFDALSDCNSYDIEHRVLLPNGKIKTLRAIGRFKKDKTDQPEHLFGTIEDITDKQEMDSALIEGQEMERARIAREVHDGIGQLLAATKFNLSAMEGMPEEHKAEQHDKIHKTLEMTIDEARRITRNLSTKILDELGLEKAIMELCTQAHDLLGLKINLEYCTKDVQFSENARRSIYRMVQESINNMLKYSKATAGLVTIKEERDSLSIVIKDNGIGFDLNDPKTKQGNGLTNLRQRAKVLYGYLDLWSKPNEGTAISINIPYENLTTNEENTISNC
ncbi:PAS domain-containing protein [Reichenbachiella agarivorans]|uniref:histidine kinase n=1 Tax=Reichenbachiella agarivorans TaxID=2979464 RepID=A0ABY6CNL0_9BACT|nr:PAS domain-containing protein [Reichenbachiella agarivorans]UXP32111.1 PAS domain-containing protein [Reichenbachiella agarivorans]